MRQKLTSVSAVIVLNDPLPEQESVHELSRLLLKESSDVEIILVDVGSGATVVELKDLVAAIPDTTCLILNERLDLDTARLIGMDNAIGDYVLVLTLDRSILAALPLVID